MLLRLFDLEVSYSLLIFRACPDLHSKTLGSMTDISVNIFARLSTGISLRCSPKRGFAELKKLYIFKGLLDYPPNWGLNFHSHQFNSGAVMATVSAGVLMSPASAVGEVS